MSDGFVLYDDAAARAAEPFALTRPFGELRAGALLIRERWERCLGSRAAGFVGSPHLAAFSEFGSPRAAGATLRAGTMVVNARFAPALSDTHHAPIAPGTALLCDGVVAAVALAEPTPLSAFHDGAVVLARFAGKARRPVRGWWLGAAWDFVRILPEMLADDAGVLANEVADEPPAHVSVLGARRLAAERGAYFEPHVVVDTTGGDVIVRSGVRIGAFTRLAGPCIVGEGTLVAGGRFTCCAIGEHSRVCGEMSVVIVAGHANKAHDGFVGHSMIGRWANLGAGTITSNLKNSYGNVRVQTAEGPRDTGMQFLGSLIGDHAKTAIGTRLMTGTIVGAGANVFGDHAPPKYVPPFAWGDRVPFERYELAKFLEVAAHVMGRRSVKLLAGLRRSLSASWHAADTSAPGPRKATAKTPARPKPASTRKRVR